MITQDYQTVEHIAEVVYKASTIRQLKTEAKALGLPGYSRLNKATLVTRLTASAAWSEETL